ncbi:hypothetical protein L596_029785 [Steinernema carpocapsae]|uniref:Uncharacterized protein n=1 Tax=Steinernema carpocapsae TaxID=34508 RepID=A0A4U5LQS6_STECR|nr:hypothetical protein L596_029785 [Steinernema carpocapsae]
MRLTVDVPWQALGNVLIKSFRRLSGFLMNFYMVDDKIGVNTETRPSCWRYLKLFGWMIVLADILLILGLLLSAPEIFAFAYDFPFFSLLVVITIICAVFGLKDERDILLYPKLVILIILIIVPLGIWLVHLTRAIYCAFLINVDQSTQRSIYQPYFNEYARSLDRFWEKNIANCTDQATFSGAISPLIASTVHSSIFLLIALEKMLEFFIFRRLLKLFALQRSLNAYPSPTPKVNDIFKPGDDTDEEIIVFERAQDNFKRDHRSGSSSASQASSSKKRSIA